MHTQDLQFMAEAIRLGEKGRYSTHPNPAVGCVLVRQGKVVGRGFHLSAGGAHAEVNALAEAGEAAKGATAYVTLEPCSFHGRTPACAAALVAAGVARVVVATLDPDPRNAGAGIQALEATGIEVSVGVLETSAKRLIRGHARRYLEGRPFVRLKLATTLDGKTALANGESRWITAAAARADVQKLRAMSSAIVTGVQTVIDDDPELNVRSELLDVPEQAAALAVQRPVYVLDSKLRIPGTSKLLQRPGNVVVCLEENLKQINGAEVIALPGDPHGIDLLALLQELAAREHSEVLFECGAKLAGSLVSARLVDELIIYVAPRLIGNSGRSLLNLPEIDRMSGLVDLRIQDIRPVGEDFRVTAALA